MKAMTKDVEEQVYFAKESQNVDPDKIDELLAVLDKDIEHIKKSLLRLNELRSLVVKRDDVSLGKLLESIQTESDSYSANELERQSIREKLATALDCNVEQMTLSQLEEILQGEKKAQVAKRKAALRSLTKELKKEHLCTALLLSDCARFNRVLLKSIFDPGKTEAITYSSDGCKKRQANMAFVNLQF